MLANLQRILLHLIVFLDPLEMVSLAAPQIIHFGLVS